MLELVTRKDPHLVPEFLPEVLELRIDPAAAVRRFLPEFIEAAIEARVSEAALVPWQRTGARAAHLPAAPPPAVLVSVPASGTTQ